MGRFEAEAEAEAEEAGAGAEEAEEEEDPTPDPRSIFRRDRRMASSRFASGPVSGVLALAELDEDDVGAALAAVVAAAELLYPGTRLHEILINLE
jgi:hypothetical protein